MRRSFYGAEDQGLMGELLRELPAILRWAMDGLARLLARRRFLQPASANELVDTISRMAAPVATFVEDDCEIDPAATVEVESLFYGYQQWCAREGLKAGSSPNLSRDLSTLIPELRVIRPRGADGRKRHYVGIRLR